MTATTIPASTATDANTAIVTTGSENVAPNWASDCVTSAAAPIPSGIPSAAPIGP